ncbi:MAG: UTP--glucose-1-phosphate uridylyltransferase, partial [Nocardioidaceae bacterium]|nr:UTP--glucose-1-phosphate uridylyltransferase [Nocardioidaceae bacterium]
MSDKGLEQARRKMADAGVDPVAIGVFEHYYRLLETGETGMIPESTIEPVDMPALADVDLPDPVPTDGLAGTVVIKLNGGLGTSMGLDRVKSVLEVRDGLRFLDVIARQVLWARQAYDVRLPLLFMNSFRTAEDTEQALSGYDLAVADLPLGFLQNREPKLLVDDLTPAEWPADPSLEWCPPGHGDLYTALHGNGLLDRLLEAGFERVFVSNSDNLGATPDPRMAEWFARSGAPFAIEAVRRTPSDRKGGHFARRTSDGRIVLRETAQTLAEDQEALADLGRHRFCSTNNLWFDLRAMRDELDRRDGVLGLAMIKNVKTVDPQDKSTPEVVQVETAMGAAIEVFDGSQLIEVTRDRFVPVKSTNDLLVLRSDCYALDEGSHLVRGVDGSLPFVDLDGDHY